ncbi:phospholipase D family protein [Candidatus Nitrotoga arctica]|uniref:phospholipase D family protein n=1 Tax=Candidatus Nitrotoga arctica TaxID=453162 RepID=UPI001EFAC3B7|nr:phospholipase D family protein [Candidatus Nitrotoga arctica]
MAVPESDETSLGVAVQPLRHAHPGLSGIVALPDGHDAFAARATLADAAQRSLDVQYYIWRNDLSGSLLFDALRRAAERGVRVRLLLDDHNTRDLDDVLRSLDAHPNIEVRLFNPFRHRKWRVLDYVTDFSRVNRRMHNKSFTADNQVTVIGGRNVGDEYFDATAGVLFVDLDVLAIGSVVTQVSSDFDKYWASDSAYPLDRLLPPRSRDADSAPSVPPEGSSDAVRAYRQAIAQSAFVRDLQARRLPFEWARTEFVSDDPAKALGRAASSDYLWARLRRVVPPAATELQLVSPYFVPTESGAAFFSDMARRGVRVSILTNSLEATDVPAVHSGYVRWREPLLAAGVCLFELKRESAAPPTRHRLFGGSSSSSLHAKTFVVDRSLLFVGSFNFDPRSARLNTELGFVIHSPTLAATAANIFAGRVQTRAYSVQLTDGRLGWIEQRSEGQLLHKQEPHAGFWRRLGVSVLSVLPIEWLL